MFIQLDNIHLALGVNRHLVDNFSTLGLNRLLSVTVLLSSG